MDDVVSPAWIHNAQRPQLIEARIRRVQFERQAIEAEFALDDAGQIFGNSLLLLVHDGGGRCLARIRGVTLIANQGVSEAEWDQFAWLIRSCSCR